MNPPALPSGLTGSEAKQRFVQFGPNIVVTKRKMRPLVAFVKKFNSPLLWIIIVAAVVSLFVGERTNAIILIFMVFVSVILDFVNTYKSEKAVEELISRVVTTATVIRDGKKQDLRPEGIVPGDLVFLSAGDVVPADGIIADSNDLFVNQSTLTGESLPVEKAHDHGSRADENFTLERNDALFMGTSIVTGYATMTVVHTGPRTAFGKIAERLSGSEPPTDFEKSIKQFSFFLLRVTVIMVTIVFLANIVAKRDLLESFIFAIAIAIGLTPELLPVIITVSLSRGAVRMSKREVIVKHLPAIQNFGRMDVFCTDKTGTLTENHIAVVKYVNCFGAVSEGVLHTAFLTSYFHTGVPNPLDEAIKEYRSWELGAVRKIDEIPFDFERRRESIVIESNGKRLLLTKGAPEAILSISTDYEEHGVRKTLTNEVQNAIEQQYVSLSQDGYKVLAVAVRELRSHAQAYEKNEEHDVALIGFVALLDPPKKSARQAIDDLEELGVEIKILTGDSPVLTKKICQVVDIPTKGTLTGDDLRKLSPDALQQAVLNHTIFARIDPEQKEEIILALQKAGKIVGFLGDGINDAPALKAADVGVSVNNAVDVAKETADIILLRHSLRVLKDGIIEGRKTFQNALKYIEMGLSSNFGNMVSMVAASAFLPFLPMLPTQILLNNFLYDSSQLSLSTDNVDDDAVKKPTIWDIHFIRKFMISFGPISSLFDFATFGLMWFYFSHSAASFQTGWFIESIATQVFVIYVIRTKRIPFLKSKPSPFLLANTLLVVLIAWIIPFTPFGKLLGFSPLPAFILAILFGYVIVYLFLVEFAKRWFDKRYRPTVRPKLATA